ncbi:MAG TPA: hypothetical protein DCP03_13935 [Polaromonas sp.]|nr:hypothetical protein [Polaromonas sp.]
MAVRVHKYGARLDDKCRGAAMEQIVTPEACTTRSQVVGAYLYRKQWDGRSHLNSIAMCQSGGVYQPLEQTGASDMKVTTLYAFREHILMTVAM